MTNQPTEGKGIKTGWFKLSSYQQIFKKQFTIPFVGKFQFILKKEKMTKVGNSLYDNLFYSIKKDELGEIQGIKFFTSSNINNEPKITR